MTDPGALGFTTPERDEFILSRKPLEQDVWDAITGGEVEGTIEGASTLTLNLYDSDRRFAEAKIFRRRVYMRAIEMDWALVQTSKSGHDFTLTFEDARVTALRSHDRATKVSRGKVTRAEFIKQQVALVKKFRIVFVCPELHKQQTQRKAGRTQEARDADREPGFADDISFKIAGSKARQGQIDQASRAMAVADSFSARGRARLAMIVAGIGESGFKAIPNAGGSGYAGVFQAHPDNIPKNDTEQQAHYFLVGGKGFQAGGAIAYAAENPSATPGDIATAVEASGMPGSFYQKWIEEARTINEAWGAGAGGDSGRTVRWGKSYSFNQGPPDGPKGENVWDMSARLAGEVGWRRFMVGKRFYYITDEELMASRPVMTLREGAAGVDTIDYDVDVNRQLDAATVTCRMDLWTAPPGSVVTIEDKGAAFGRWLVSNVRRDLFSTGGTIELIRKAALLDEKPEPRRQQGERTDEGSTGGGPIEGTPKEIIDSIALPMGRDEGLKTPSGETLTAANNDAANRRHTHLGSASDHAGPRGTKWATDMSNGSSPTDEMDKVAAALAERFAIPWSGSGLKSATHGGFRYQLIYRYSDPQAGNHYNHIHFGVKKV